MSHFTACIPHRGSTLGLWMTVQSIELAAAHAKLTPAYSIVCNGKEVDEPLQNLANHLDGRIHFQHSREALPPPIARNMAAEKAESDMLLFFDDHVMLWHDWFTYMWFSTDSLRFSSYDTGVGYRYFHYLWNPQEPTKGDYSIVPISSDPYQVLSAPNGGFACLKSVWDAIGGYDDFWDGFGGEEAYLCLKARLKGFECWMNPQAVYYHFSCRSAVRGYPKDINPRNYELALENLKKLGDIQPILDRFSHHRLQIS